MSDLKYEYEAGPKGCLVYELLNGLYLHCYAVNHEGATSDYDFYAERLDRLGVPFWVQNNVSALAELRTSIHMQGEESRVRSCCEL